MFLVTTLLPKKLLFLFLLPLEITSGFVLLRRNNPCCPNHSQSNHGGAASIITSIVLSSSPSLVSSSGQQQERDGDEYDLELLEEASSSSSSSSSESGPSPPHELLPEFLSTLFAACAYIRDPKIYSNAWANSATIMGGALTTTTNVHEGEILSLVPIDLLGLQDDSDFIVCDELRDGDYFYYLQDDLDDNTNKIHMPLSIAISGKPYPCPIDVDVNPNQPLQPGWMGHLATRQKEEDAEEENPNCIILRLLDHGPICALVATTFIPEGTQLVQQVRSSSAGNWVQDDNNPQIHAKMVSYYESELHELGCFLELAYQPPIIVPWLQPRVGSEGGT